MGNSGSKQHRENTRREEERKWEEEQKREKERKAEEDKRIEVEEERKREEERKIEEQKKKDIKRSEDIAKNQPALLIEGPQDTKQIESGNMELVKAVSIEKPKQKIMHEDTPLMQAAKQGDAKRARELLEGGEDVNIVNSQGMTALHRAAQNLDLRTGYDVAIVLVEWKIDLNVKTFKFERTALADAVYTGNEKLVKFLLESGAEVNITKPTLLYEAIQYAKGAPIVKLLLEHGATTQLESESILIKAVYCNSEIVQLLLKHRVPIDAKENKTNKKPIEIAVEKSFFNTARVLIEHGADICHFDNHGRSLLYNAVANGNVDLVWTLMLNGANIEWDTAYPTVWDMSRKNIQMKKALLHFWTPRDHWRHPKSVRKAVMSFLIIAKRQKWMFDKSILFLIFSYFAFPTPMKIQNDN